MKDYAQIIATMKGTPWLITEDSLRMIVDIVNRHISGEMSQEEIKLRLEGVEQDVPRMEVGGGVGILPLMGPIFPKANLMTEISGATSLETFSRDLKSLVDNPRVEQIILDIDSPGGSSRMVQETGEKVKAAREIKPIYAVANSMSASAAYWLMSQATEAYATPSGSVGGIGVYTVVEDLTERNKDEGRKVTVIKAGEYKDAGSPDVPLSSEAKEYIQDMVDKQMDKFVNAVATGRSTSRDKVMEYADGRVFNSDDALALGMIDGIQTLDQVISGCLEVNGGGLASVGASALAGALHSRHATAQFSWTGDSTNIPNITATGFKMEVAEKEHSEPGSGLGGEPEPRTDGDDLNTERQHRRDTPPLIDTEEMMEELITALRAQGVEIPESVDSLEGLATHVTAMDTELKAANTELEPLREAAKSAGAKRAFARDYPDEAAKLEELETKDREVNAHAFAMSFERFSKEGTTERTPYGFSANVLTGVEQFALDLSNKQATLDNFKTLLESIGNNGIVDYSEKGSSVREGWDNDEIPVDVADQNPRVVFSKVVQHYMVKDEIDFNAAVKFAAEKHPDLAEAYHNYNPTAS